MKSITELRIVEAKELLHFQQLTTKFLKITLPLDYLEQSHVYLYQNKKGAPVAGYLINDTSSLRLMSQIPPNEESKDVASTPFDSADFFEINALWISPRLNTGWNNLYIWWRMTYNLLKMKKKVLLISANTSNKTILKYHQLMKPVTIYEGAPYMVHQNDQSYNVVRYSYVRKSNIALAWFRGVSMIFKKLKVT